MLTNKDLTTTAVFVHVYVVAAITGCDYGVVTQATLLQPLFDLTYCDGHFIIS